MSPAIRVPLAFLMTMTACGEVVRTISDGAVTDPIFVSSSRGDDANPGAKASPVKSLAHAIAIANGRAINACGETFDESIVVPSGSTLHGALDCTQDWAYNPTTPSRLIAAADSIPLTLAGGSATTIVTDFDIEAFDAKLVGGSSIAVLVDTGSAELDHCRVIAGAGSNGAVGSSRPPLDASANGLPGVDDGQCFMVSPTAGGTGGTQSCGAIDVSGGAGGTGTTSAVGGNGFAGAPLGVGDGGAGNGQGVIPCTAGHPGAIGPAGASSNGAHGLGTLSASGFAAPLPSAASAGSAGQGGGGGGGGKQCNQALKAGSSGGGGGGGGCGGNAGNAGGSGGSSLGIIAVNANLELLDITITTGTAGDGGAGGDGQQGGLGGQPGGGGNTGACAGGVGGSGGRGGSGGGGAGGHSIGVAFVGSAPDLGTVNLAIGTAGIGALGGDISMTARGDDGKACKALDFANASSCVQ